MTYRVKISSRAQRDIDAFGRYCRKHSFEFWQEHAVRLAHVFETLLPESPQMWSHFFVTGAPYRAYLFDAGVRTKYWLVYSIDEESRTVRIMRMWNAASNPKKFRV